MPTVADLERLDALVGRLVPLTNTQRGTPVRAQDWNDVVGALIEVARVILAEEREGVVAPHEHPDQVKMAWLDPLLRAVVERGPLADPAAVARVADVERRLGRLTDRIGEVDAGAKEARDQVGAVSTRDLVRESQVTAMRRTVEGLSDARDSILELRESLRSIDDNVRLAVDVGQRLVVDGQPVDLAAWDQRLRSLEELRTRLTQPDGQLLDAGALERRLSDLINTFVTEEELDEILASRPVTVPPEALASIEEELRGSLMSQVDGAMTALADQIRSETSQALAGVDAQVAQRVADAIPGVVSSVLDTIRPEISSAVDTALAQVQALLDQRLADLHTTIDGELEQRIGDVLLQIPPAVSAELDSQLPARLGAINEQLAAFATQLDEARARLDQHDAILRELLQPDDFTRINGLSADAAALLVKARVMTFFHLSQLTVDEIARITGIPVERVIKLEIIAQARKLAFG